MILADGAVGPFVMCLMSRFRPGPWRVPGLAIMRGVDAANIVAVVSLAGDGAIQNSVAIFGSAGKAADRFPGQAWEKSRNLHAIIGLPNAQTGGHENM